MASPARSLSPDFDLIRALKGRRSPGQWHVQESESEFVMGRCSLSLIESMDINDPIGSSQNGFRYRISFVSDLMIRYHCYILLPLRENSKVTVLAKL